MLVQNCTTVAALKATFGIGKYKFLMYLKSPGMRLLDTRIKLVYYGHPAPEFAVCNVFAASLT